MSRNLRIVVLGCGYVGTEFALQAQAHGHAVVGVVRSAESRERLDQQGVVAVACDLSGEDWSALPAVADVVVYAASTGGSGADAYARTYDQGVKRALAWARGVGAGHFLFTSSTGVYRQDDGLIVTESSPVGGTPTADAILAGEAAVLSAGFTRATVLRLGGLYGPGRHYLLDQLRRGENVIGGRVDHFVNYLHRDDAAGALLAAIEGSVPGARVFNVTDGQPITKADLAVWLSGKLGLAQPIFDAAAPAGPRMRRTGQAQPSRVVDSGRIRAELAWQPRFSSVCEGLAQYLG